MTPLSRFYARHLPAWALWPALTATYALALILVILFAEPIRDGNIYIDVERLR